jgi:hypothetical protein
MAIMPTISHKATSTSSSVAIQGREGMPANLSLVELEHAAGMFGTQRIDNLEKQVSAIQAQLQAVEKWNQELLARIEKLEHEGNE